MNKSATYNHLTVKVTNIDNHVVTYKLKDDYDSTRTFKWQAKHKQDKAVVEQLQVGKLYHINTSTDAWGVQHWSNPSEITTDKQIKDAYFEENAYEQYRTEIKRKRIAELDIKLVIYED